MLNSGRVRRAGGLFFVVVGRFGESRAVVCTIVSDMPSSPVLVCPVPGRICGRILNFGKCKDLISEEKCEGNGEMVV